MRAALLALLCPCGAAAAKDGAQVPEELFTPDANWAVEHGLCIPRGSDLNPADPFGEPLSLEEAKAKCLKHAACRGFTFRHSGGARDGHVLQKGTYWMFLKSSQDLFEEEGWVTYLRRAAPVECPAEASARAAASGEEEDDEETEEVDEEEDTEAAVVVPPPPEDAERLYRRAVKLLRDIDQHGSTEGAVRDLSESAAAGHAGAQLLLGLLYTLGIGVEPDEGRAVLFFTFASLGGDPDAALVLAHRYEHGIGVEKDCDQAQRYYRAAADVVAKSHREGGVAAHVSRVRLSDPTAPRTRERETDLVHYHQLTADRGDRQSQLLLGYAFMWGIRGARQNGAMAVHYLTLAAAQDSAQAHGALGQIYANGMPSPEDPIAVNYTRALQHFRHGAKLRHSASLNGLGYLYLRGLGVQKDSTMAASFFRQAAAQDHAEAHYNLGLLHLYGQGVAKDVREAIQQLRKAARQGQLLAHWQLGVLLQEGKLVTPDCPQALGYFRAVCDRGPWMKRLDTAYGSFLDGDDARALFDYLIAAEQGIEVAQVNAGWLLQHGKGHEDLGVTRSNPAYEDVNIPVGHALRSSPDWARYSLALKYWRRAADMDVVEGIVKIGDAFYYGWGQEEDKSMALQTYMKAAERKSGLAMFNLGYMYEHGMGIQRDFNLAKRWYDDAVEAYPSAWLPVTLARWGLSLHWALRGDPQPLPGEAGSESEGRKRREMRKTLLFGLTPEDIVLGLLTALILVLLLIRHTAPIEAQPQPVPVAG